MEQGECWVDGGRGGLGGEGGGGGNQHTNIVDESASALFVSHRALTEADPNVCVFSVLLCLLLWCNACIDVR